MLLKRLQVRIRYKKLPILLTELIKGDWTNSELPIQLQNFIKLDSMESRKYLSERWKRYFLKCKNCWSY